jgi:predicted GNAT family acetyltransferase
MRPRILDASNHAALERFLLMHRESSMILLGNLGSAGLHDDGQRYSATYCALFNGEEICAVAAHYWNGLVLLQAPTQALELAKAAVQASGRAFNGVIGPANQVAEIKAGLHELAHAAGELAVGRELQHPMLDSVEKLYSLQIDKLHVPQSLRSGELGVRLMRWQDVELMTDWRVGYTVALINEEDTPALREKSREAVEQCHSDQRMWILEAEGQAVACSDFNASLEDTVQVGGVWTPPALRGRGYARAVVAGSLLAARSRGVEQAVLFTGVDNVPAQKAYEAIGFHQIGFYHLLLFKP